MQTLCGADCEVVLQPAQETVVTAMQHAQEIIVTVTQHAQGTVVTVVEQQQESSYCYATSE